LIYLWQYLTTQIFRQANLLVMLFLHRMLMYLYIANTLLGHRVV